MNNRSPLVCVVQMEGRCYLWKIVVIARKTENLFHFCSFHHRFHVLSSDFIYTCDCFRRYVTRKILSGGINYFARPDLPTHG
jgi:hypothetical protein